MSSGSGIFIFCFWPTISTIFSHLFGSISANQLKTASLDLSRSCRSQIYLSDSVCIQTPYFSSRKPPYHPRRIYGAHIMGPIPVIETIGEPSMWPFSYGLCTGQRSLARISFISVWICLPKGGAWLNFWTKAYQVQLRGQLPPPSPPNLVICGMTYARLKWEKCPYINRTHRTRIKY